MSVGSVFLFNFDILQPVIIANSVMTVSLFLGVLNIEKWNLYVGSYTSIIFITGMMAFESGGIFAQYYFFSRSTIDTKIEKKEFNFSIKVILLITFFILVLAYLSCSEMYKMSIALGNHDGLTNMIKTLRYPLEKGEITFSRWIRYRDMIAMSFATVSLYVFVYQIIFSDSIKKKLFFYLLPVFAVTPFFLLSTGRRSMVHFVITGCVMAGILYQQRYGYNHLVRLRMLKFLEIAGIFSICLYFLMGFCTGKVRVGGRSPFDIISHYGGLSVPALDQFFNSIMLENQYLGQNAFKSIYGNLNTLGFQLERGRDFLPFVSFKGTETITTNVYTVFYRLMVDWSFPGMMIIMFLFGILLTFYYDYLKYHSNHLLLIIYASFGYIPFFLFIDDQFMTIFKTNNLYFAMLCFLILQLFEKNTKKLFKPRKNQLLNRKNEPT